MKSTLQGIVDTFFLLQEPSTAYYAEASIQLKVAIEIFKQMGVESVLERKIPGIDEYLDIFTALNEQRYGIELKYKTHLTADPAFEYKAQGAQNDGRYDFVWDIRRLEVYKARGVIDKGFALLLTNDHIYWSESRPTSAVATFNLNPGRVLSGTLTPRWKSRTTAIPLAGKYTVVWSQIRKALNSESSFRYCLIEV